MPNHIINRLDYKQFEPYNKCYYFLEKNFIKEFKNHDTHC